MFESLKKKNNQVILLKKLLSSKINVLLVEICERKLLTHAENHKISYFVENLHDNKC